MTKWVNIQDALPNTEIECVVAAREHSLVYVHKTFAQWDGSCWIDANGEEIENVIAWTRAPSINRKVMETLEKLRKCVENDKCEEKDCCYFVTLDLLEALLEYINE